MSHPPPEPPPAGPRRARLLLQQAQGVLSLPGRSVPGREVTAVNRDFGKDLPSFARAAAAALEDCPEPFAGLSSAPQDLRARDARIGELLDFKAWLDSLGAQVAREVNALRVEQARDVTQVLRAADATQLHPGTSPELKGRLAGAMVSLSSLRERRSAEITAARERTRARNAEHASISAGQAAEIAELKGELAQRQLEDRLLSGQPLRLEDFPRPPLPSGPRSG